MMDPKVVFDLLQTGGPIGMAAVFCWMWWLERQDRKAAESQLFELATASVETSTKTEVALSTLTRLIETRRGD
jgi:predicted negative regulator of RcsB-dependent stress response